MAKIIDVAQRAGVSPSTVSHVLNGKRPISEATRKRVLAAIEELQYRPNANAQALKRSRSGIIGFFAADITELFVTEIIRGVESVIVPQDQHLLLVSGAEFGSEIDRALDFLTARTVDGLIVSYAVSQEIADIDLAVGDLPIVTINGRLNDRIPSVEPDNRSGGAAAARHLTEAGATRIAVLAGPANRAASRKRLEGIRRESAARGPAIVENGIVHTEFSFDGGVSGMRTLLERGLVFDGLFCANDYIAAGAMAVADIEGIQIPEQLKIVGFDDREFASFWPTPITTFQQPLYDMGRIAARYIDDRIVSEAPIPLTTLLDSRLIVRNSSVRRV